MMKGSVALRPYSSITGDSTNCASKSHGSSTLMGPRMHPHDGRVVSNFIIQALLGREITIYGDGSQTRSFCYVDDLIDGLVRLMQTGDDVTGPINIGNPVEFSMLRACARGGRSHRIEIAACAQAIAARRPEAAPAGYFKGATAARLEAGDDA